MNRLGYVITIPFDRNSKQWLIVKPKNMDVWTFPFTEAGVETEFDACIRLCHTQLGLPKNEPWSKRLIANSVKEKINANNGVITEFINMWFLIHMNSIVSYDSDIYESALYVPKSDILSYIPLGHRNNRYPNEVSNIILHKSGLLK